VICAVETCGETAVAWIEARDPANTPLLTGTMENVRMVVCQPHAKVAPFHDLGVKYFGKFRAVKAFQGEDPDGEES